MLDKLETADVLIVTKLDRLGRDVVDMSVIVDQLEAVGVRVYCLALGVVDRTSPAGKMTTQVINAVSEFERDLLIERVNFGVKRAKGFCRVNELKAGRHWPLHSFPYAGRTCPASI